ncbi:MAG: TolC family protein [Gracilibacteraceae bacterium]|nr:TolC family protein [Gracilibacteraceae bacterium]
MRAKKTAAVLLLSLLPLTPFYSPVPAAAAPPPKILVTEQAQNLALAADTTIKKKNSDLILKRIKYTEAVEGARVKAKNMSTFRWSPLLSFKFPEPLDLVLDYDLSATPLILQIEIGTLQHEKDDKVFEVRQRVAKLFADVYIGQEKIAFSQKRLTAARDSLARNRARLLLGQAKQADIDAGDKAVKALETELALNMRVFENDKQELSEQIRLDVSTGYVFKNPLKILNISRGQLDGLVNYTLSNDHVYYAARMTESIARISLDSYESLFRRQYGGKVNAISPFLSQARQGTDIDNSAFRMTYDAMTRNFDAPWSGRLRILFFTFSREWFKGPIAGTRYIQDEMYALYTAALDYLAARRDRETAERDLRKEIASSYETLVTAKNSVESLLDTVAETKTALNRLVELNRLGKADFSEVQDKQTDYEEQQAEAIELLASYYGLFIDFDRLTCGAAGRLASGTGSGAETGQGGLSWAEEGETEDDDGGIGGLGEGGRLDYPTYHIYPDVADMVFAFGVQIPENYEPAIDEFEILYEGTRLGDRTPIARELRHLVLDYGETKRLSVRLFYAGEFVAECEIDTTVPSDILPIGGRTVPAPPGPRVVGTYSVQTERNGENFARTEITLRPQETEAFYYRLTAEGTGLLSETPAPVSQPFRYLALLSDLAAVRVEFYDREQTLLYTARFAPETLSLVVEP